MNQPDVRLGLKLWSSNYHLIGKAAELIRDGPFGYIEITVIPGTSVAPYLSHDLPYIVHAPTELSGLNISDRSRKSMNNQLLTMSVEWADKLRSPWIILHPGYGDLADAVQFLSEIHEPRILIENEPKVGIHHEKMTGYSPESMRMLMMNRFGFCFDINHGIKASISLGENVEEFLSGFMSLSPVMFHVADGMMNVESDEHLPLGKGQYDLSLVRRILSLKPGSLLTLETPRFTDDFSDDIVNMNTLFPLSQAS